MSQSIPLGPFQIFRKFAEILASQGAPPLSTTPVANLPLMSMTLAAKLPPVSMTPVANLPPVSTTQVVPVSLVFLPVANFPPVSTMQLQICRQCRWNMEKISGCWLLKKNLKAKIYIYVNSTTQRCPNKIIKIFLIEIFLPFATSVNDTGGASWAANISANFRKNLKWP